MFTVPPASFYPSPSVESAVIRCKVRDKPPVDVLEEKAFFRIVKAAFSQRRKIFSNTLKAAGIPSELVVKMLDKAGIDGGRRGETLSLTEFAAVANAWVELR